MSNSFQQLQTVLPNHLPMTLLSVTEKKRNCGKVVKALWN